MHKNICIIRVVLIKNVKLILKIPYLKDPTTNDVKCLNIKLYKT